VHRRGRIVYNLVEFKTVTKHKQIFVHKPDVRSSLMQANVTATECCG